MTKSSDSSPEEGPDRPKASREETSSDEVVDSLANRIRRKRRARQRGDQPLWFGLGMFGLVGWSVAVPTVLGLLVGLWLDRVFESTRNWTLALLVAGIVLGCFNAWHWVAQMMREEDDRQTEAPRAADADPSPSGDAQDSPTDRGGGR